MNTKKLARAILILMLLVTAGCRALHPDPQVISVETKPFFFYPDVDITIRNKGAAGNVLIVLQQGNEWQKKIVYFDRDEQRMVRISCPNFTSGEYMRKIVAAELASPEDLRGTR